MEEQIKELRIKIDGLAQLSKELKPIESKPNLHGYSIKNELVTFTFPGVNSKEIEKAVDSLYLAKAWLGKILGELGEATPYTNDGKRKTVEDIEPAADTHPTIPENIGMAVVEINNNIDRWQHFNHIEKVDWLREEIEILVKNLNKIINPVSYTNKPYNIRNYKNLSEKYLCEARFWLGFELQRIKENE